MQSKVFPRLQLCARENRYTTILPNFLYNCSMWISINILIASPTRYSFNFIITDIDFTNFTLKIFITDLLKNTSIRRRQRKGFYIKINVFPPARFSILWKFIINFKFSYKALYLLFLQLFRFVGLILTVYTSHQKKTGRNYGYFNFF